MDIHMENKYSTHNTYANDIEHYTNDIWYDNTTYDEYIDYYNEYKYLYYNNMIYGDITQNG